MQLALVDDAHCLTFAAGDGFRCHQVDLRADAQHGADGSLQGLLPGGVGLDGIVKLLRGHLDVDIQGIRVVDPVYQDLIVGAVALLEQDRLDLGREDIDAADDHHIIAAAHGLVHPDVGPAAGAFFPGQHADIPRTVADDGEGFFVQARKDQLAFAALGQDLAGVRVDDFGNEMVLIDVHPRLGLTLEGDAGHIISCVINIVQHLDLRIQSKWLLRYGIGELINAAD